MTAPVAAANCRATSLSTPEPAAQISQDIAQDTRLVCSKLYITTTTNTTDTFSMQSLYVLYQFLEVGFSPSLVGGVKKHILSYFMACSRANR